LARMTWHLSPSQRRSSQNPPISLCVSMCIIARQRFGRHVPAATNTNVRIEELLEAPFSIRFVYRRFSGSIYPPIVVRQQLAKYFPAIMDCWYHFLCSPCSIKGKYAICSSQNFLLLTQFLFFFSYPTNYDVQQFPYGSCDLLKVKFL
jgi:hypothetical protein